MDARADAADALDHKDHLIVVLEPHKAFKPAMDKTKLGHGPDHGFIFHHKLDVQRLGQYGMLRPERNHGCAVAHAFSPLAVSSLAASALAAGRRTVVMVKYGAWVTSPSRYMAPW